MLDQPDSFVPNKVELVLTELGRCVLLYQMIERHLKYLLPHVTPVGSEVPLKGEGISNWRVFFDSPTTLGSLVKKLAERNRSPTAQITADQLTDLVRYRNELVHHFFDQPFWRMESQPEYEAALHFINERHRAAMPFLEFLESASETLLTELRKVQAHSRLESADAIRRSPESRR